METSALLLLTLLPLVSATSGGLTDKGLLFPRISEDSYVKLTPLKPLDLDAFTLCMRVSVNPDVTDDPERETILFAYRTPDVDEVHVWQEKGKMSLQIKSSFDGALYSTPLLSIFPTNLCLTWESSTGLTAFWLDGRRTTLQVYRKGQKIQPGGIVVLGQDLDTSQGKFDEKQSFVGEIRDLNMWDRVLTADQIKHFSEEQRLGTDANVLNWNTLQYEVKGNVIVVPEKYY